MHVKRTSLLPETGHLPAESTPAAPFTAGRFAFPRWTFGGYCTICLVYACQDQKCAAASERHVWAVCPECKGSTYKDIDAGPDHACTPCDCAFGAVEVYPTANDPGGDGMNRTTTATAEVRPLSTTADGDCPARRVGDCGDADCSCVLCLSAAAGAAPLARCLGCGQRTGIPHDPVDCPPIADLWQPCPGCHGVRRTRNWYIECVACCGAGFVPSGGALVTLADLVRDIPPPAYTVPAAAA